jgi:hypothetical protein
MAHGGRSGFAGCGIFFSNAIALVPAMLGHKHQQEACLMTLGAFVRNKSHRSAFQNADLWWWLDRLTLGL